MLTKTLLVENDAHYMVDLPGVERHEITAKELVETPIEAWMFHALVARKEMQIQDQTVALRKNETLRALVMFIPKACFHGESTC